MASLARLEKDAICCNWFPDMLAVIGFWSLNDMMRSRASSFEILLDVTSCTSLSS